MRIMIKDIKNIGREFNSNRFDLDMVRASLLPTYNYIANHGNIKK